MKVVMNFAMLIPNIAEVGLQPLGAYKNIKFFCYVFSFMNE